MLQRRNQENRSRLYYARNKRLTMKNPLPLGFLRYGVLQQAP